MADCGSLWNSHSYTYSSSYGHSHIHSYGYAYCCWNSYANANINNVSLPGLCN
jgi:hypothetical protein